MSGTVTTGRTINGHTYSDAPVDVKLGPNTFRIPANYLDSQIAPWPGEGVTLVIEWPDMTPLRPGHGPTRVRMISARRSQFESITSTGLLSRHH